MSYTDVFGGALVYPSDFSYAQESLTETDYRYVWPGEAVVNNIDDSEVLVLALISDLTSVAGVSLMLPDATKGTPGSSFLFNNYGEESISLLDHDGGAVATLGSGEAWFVYLVTGADEAGEWRSFQYGSFMSVANAADLAGSGLTSSGNQLLPDIPVSELNDDFTLSETDRGRAYKWIGAGGTITLPDGAGAEDGWFAYFKNSGSASIAIEAAGSSEIDGENTKTLNVGDSCIVIADGSNYFSIGFGQSVEFAFDTVSIDVAGTGDYTLTGNELNRISYAFTGILTGNRNVIVPATVQQYWVRNATTGSFTLTVKTAAGTGSAVVQGGGNILYSDGTDVYNATTGGIATPVAIADGGTGATTASNARTNLGAGSTGNAIFVADTTATVWGVLGRAPSGTIDGGTF